MKNQSIEEIINNQPADFVHEIMRSENVPHLQQQLKRTRNADRKAVIEARIENLKHLMV